MTGALIHHLLSLVPDELLSSFSMGHWARANPYSGHSDPDGFRFALLYSKPDFGWSFARLLAENDLPFPTFLQGDDEIVFRAYLYHSNPSKYRDKYVIQALEMSSYAMSELAFKIRPMLLPKDSTVDKVAEIMNMPRGLVAAYERLFYNVTDRKQDAAYLNKIIFPTGRISEYFDDYLKTNNYEALMARAGITNGLEEVAFLAGFNNSLVDGISTAESAKQLEARLMSVGYVMARNGWINQSTNSTALYNARQLITAGKIGGTENTASSSEFVYMSDVVWQELRRVKRKEMETAAKKRDGLSVEGIVVEPIKPFEQLDRNRQATPAV